MKTKNSPYSLSSFLQFLNDNFGMLFLLVSFFLAGFMVGSLWTENKILKSGTSLGGKQPDQAAEAPPAPSGPDSDTLSKMPPVTSEDHIRGDINAKVVLVEYSDIECPFCNRFHPTMVQIQEEYPDQVAWVFRHYPLSFHASAQKAAEATECVAKYGGNLAFWEYIDLLFERMATNVPDALNIDQLPILAQNFGVSSAKIKNCLDTDEMAQVVSDQMTAGSTAGVSGTPGTIIVTSDGKFDFIPGALPYEQVKEMVEKYL